MENGTSTKWDPILVDLRRLLFEGFDFGSDFDHDDDHCVSVAATLD